MKRERTQNVFCDCANTQPIFYCLSNPLFVIEFGPPINKFVIFKICHDMIDRNVSKSNNSEAQRLFPSNYFWVCEREKANSCIANERRRERKIERCPSYMAKKNTNARRMYIQSHHMSTHYGSTYFFSFFVVLLYQAQGFCEFHFHG